MKVIIVLDFDVDLESKRGQEIVSEVLESAETIRIGFDADDVLVDYCGNDKEKTK
jgi:hypothetical protein